MSKSRKKPQEANSKTKSTNEKIDSVPMAPKKARRSSSRLKSVTAKLNYFTEQDEENF